MRLDAVAVGIDGEGGIVLRAVVGAHTRLAVVLAAGLQRRGVKGVDRGAVLGDEAEMQARFGVGLHRLLGGAEPQRDRLVAVAQRGLAIAEAAVTQRLQRGVVELLRAGDVGDADRDMVEHGFLLYNWITGYMVMAEDRACQPVNRLLSPDDESPRSLPGVRQHALLARPSRAHRDAERAGGSLGLDG